MSEKAAHKLEVRWGNVERAARDPETLFRGDQALPCFESVEAAVRTLRPAEPLLCSHPDELVKNAKLFLKSFPGMTLYAVKANPDPYVLTHLYRAGIRHCDVASLGEIRLLRGLLPDMRLAFMHPVKGREAIHEAYFNYGIRDFVLDTADELRKIREETKGARDLTLVVRLDRPKGSAACPLAGKFGAMPDQAVELLRAASKIAQKVGLSFHVGSQTLEPASYVNAIREAGDVIRKSGVEIGAFNVGGGFPIPDLGMDVPPLSAYFDVIRKEIAELKLPPTTQVWCEPGRALSGTSTTLVTRVELRKGDVLYLNDGSFGNMFEVCSMRWRNTAKVIYADAQAGNTAELRPFHFYGPTCDSVDYMPGPFVLPADIKEGDWIALRGMGSYMAASRTSFNGFATDLHVEIKPISTGPMEKKSFQADVKGGA